MEATQPRVSDTRGRASVWELVFALAGSILVLPAALFAAVLGASDEWLHSVAVAVVYGFPLVVWAAVVVALVYYWRIGSIVMHVIATLAPISALSRRPSRR